MASQLCYKRLTALSDSSFPLFRLQNKSDAKLECYMVLTSNPRRAKPFSNTVDAIKDVG